MIQGTSTRRLFESLGPRAFVQKTRSLLGLAADRHGRPSVTTGELTAEEFSIRDLAESILGPDWPKLVSGQGPALTDLLEMDAAVVPSAFANLAAFHATVGSLLEVKLLEQYRRPEFLADKLARVIPTRYRADRIPGLTVPGDLAEAMSPATPHPRAQFAERYVDTPETEKFGLAIDIARETVFFDQTRQVLMQAEEVGQWLGLRKEKRVLDVVLGIKNAYSYRGTSYATFQTSGSWMNSHSNPLEDWTDLDNALQLFAEMSDAESGERILAWPKTILVMPYKFLKASHVLNATEVQTQTAGGAETRRAENPLFGRFDLLTSPIAYQRLTEPNGANLPSAQAKEYLFFGDFQRAFGYMENWAMSVERANPGDYTMRDKDLVLSVFANEMGTPTVLEPRQIVRNTN